MRDLTADARGRREGAGDEDERDERAGELHFQRLDEGREERERREREIPRRRRGYGGVPMRSTLGYERNLYARGM